MARSDRTIDARPLCAWEPRRQANPPLSIRGVPNVRHRGDSKNRRFRRGPGSRRGVRRRHGDEVGFPRQVNRETAVLSPEVVLKERGSSVLAPPVRRQQRPVCAAYPQPPSSRAQRPGEEAVEPGGAAVLGHGPAHRHEQRDGGVDLLLGPEPGRIDVARSVFPAAASTSIDLGILEATWGNEPAPFTGRRSGAKASRSG